MVGIDRHRIVPVKSGCRIAEVRHTVINQPGAVDALFPDRLLGHGLVAALIIHTGIALESEAVLGAEERCRLCDQCIGRGKGIVFGRQACRPDRNHCDRRGRKQGNSADTRHDTCADPLGNFLEFGHFTLSLSVIGQRKRLDKPAFSLHEFVSRTVQNNCNY